MSQVFTIGRVTADLELKTSQKKNHYVLFSIAESIGYGKNARTQYLQVWANGDDAKALVKAKVKKGSLIWVFGSIELEEFMKQDGKTSDKRLKITLDNWGYVVFGKSKNGKVEPNPNAHPNIEPGNESPSVPSGGKIDGERENLPE